MCCSSCHQLAPDYEGIELGIGEGLLVKAIAEVTGRRPSQIKAELGRVGDLGTVAQASKSSQPSMFRGQALTVPYVFASLKEIARASGTQSQTRKLAIIRKVFSSCTGNEPKFFVRSLEGKLRIGLAEKSVLVALADAMWALEKERGQNGMTKPEAEQLVRDVYSRLPSYDVVVPAMLQHGLSGLAEHCKLTPGVPVKPMLAKPTRSITEVLDRFASAEENTFTCEYKYDGERAQLHYSREIGGRVYSRNSENMSERYPDILAALPSIVKPPVESVILDCEAVAWDRQDKRILPFQMLSTRKRKDVREEDIKVQVCLFAFDLLYLNGEPLIHLPLRERRERLHQAFTPVPGRFEFATALDAHTAEDMEKFLDASVRDSCEGLMVKLLTGAEAGYEPSKRSHNWLKVKKDYLAGVGDSLDLVVIGAFLGKGKRTNVYGAFLLACYDPDAESYQAITKIGTGFSEQDLEDLHQRLRPLVVSGPKSYFVYAETAPADVWFEPKLLMEVKTADLSLSPVYKAALGMVSDTKGVSLRFPRCLRIRDDKDATDATTAEQVADMYRAQVSQQQQTPYTQEAEDY